MRQYTADRVRTQDTAGVIEQATVVVDDAGRITWVGPVALRPAEFAHVPATHVAGTLMPGLVDTHVHLGFDGGPNPVARMTSETVAEQVVLMLADARQLLSAGVTTARDLGARDYLDVVVRNAVARGDARGPRIVASGSPLTPTGGHCWYMGGEADSADELRRVVRRHHRNGVDSIKIMSTGGFMTAGSAPWNAQFSQEELACAITDAHRLGKKAVAHAHGVQGMRAAMAAGIDALEHCTFIGEDGSLNFDAALADEIVERGVYVSFTHNILAWNMIRDGGALAEHFTKTVTELAGRGALIVTGTDAGIDFAPHHAYAAGLESLHRCGMSVEDVLDAATARAALSLGLEAETGCLRAGLAADLIGVDGDPGQDLTVLRRPRLVVAGGRPFTPDPYPDLTDLPRPDRKVTIGQRH